MTATDVKSTVAKQYTSGVMRPITRTPIDQNLTAHKLIKTGNCLHFQINSPLIPLQTLINSSYISLATNEELYLIGQT